ncbi:MAG TPA: TonB-dependent receptor [Steroidobacter sp.]|uniref:TonB-dependent receptor domain-containing protein n=1 Tax=Steroidobacter sp. TaxID=1978227 RepID=UPI002EDB98D9
MSEYILLRRAVRTALLFGAAATMAAPISTALAAEEEGIQEVVVTGSRISRPEVEASTPVQVLSSDAILQQGSPNIADIINELPSVGTPGLSRTNSNFLTSGNGVSTINLRNMDDKRTLVLVNGRRVVSGVGGTSTVDINNIPTDLLESTQILTGGASAVYGSEAVAGVVNFVLKNDFEGVGLRAQTGTSSESDRGTDLVSLTLGKNIGDRGNVTFNVQYDKDDGLRSRERAISANDNPARSSLTPQGSFIVPRGATWTYNPDNQLQRGFNTPVNGFNRNAERYIAVPLERTLYTALAHYDITDSTQVFFEGSYSEMESNSSLEPLATDNSDAVLNGVPLQGLSLDNPFIPDPIRQEMIANGATTLGFRKRMNGVFDRSNVNDRDFHRFVVGFKGEIFDGWDWDVYYNQSRTKEYTASETALRDRYYYALDVISGPGGTPICRNDAARAAGCAPFNPFGFNSVSPEAADYITNGGQLDWYRAEVEQKVVAANISGSLFALPAGDLQIAAGLERRWEDSSERFSEDTQAGNTMGNALTNTDGDYTVNEAYVEALVPLLKDAPGAHALDFEAAFRVGDYSTVDEVFSWKTGLTYAPIEDVRFRAVYSVATRAPNIGELYQGANQTFPTGLVDPCEGVTATSTGAADAYCRSIPAIAEQIAANGVFEYTQSDIQSIEGRELGNPDVEEEEAKTWTVGVVLTPAFLPSFTASIDWFQIEIDDAITLIPRQTAIDECAFSGGTSERCALVTREDIGTPRPRTPGTLFNIDSNYINAASIKTSGVDVASSYTFDFASNQRLRFAVNYTYLDKLTLQSGAGEPVENNVGQLSGDGRLGAGFEHRAVGTINYGIGDFTATWRMNYLSKMKDTLIENGGDPDDEGNTVGSYVYHDVNLRYQFGAEQQYSVYLGVDNVFDKLPPVLNQLRASHITGTETAADTYDPIGRYGYAGLQVKF